MSVEPFDPPRRGTVRAGAAEQTLQRAVAALLAAGDVVLVVEAGGRIQFASDAVQRVLGYEARELVRMPIRELCEPEDVRTFDGLVDAITAPPTDLRLLDKRGRPRWIEATVVRTATAIGDSAVLICRDVDDKKRAERERDAMVEALERAHDELRRVVITDTLTGLSNRSRLLEQLEAEVERARRRTIPLCIALADLDELRRRNDRLGQAAGDGALRFVGSVVKSECRADDLAGRLESDKIVFAFHGTHLEGARVAAERLRKNVEERSPQTLGDGLTISIGVAELAPGETLDELIARAERAVARAKSRGRNCVEIVQY